MLSADKGTKTIDFMLEEFYDDGDYYEEEPEEDADDLLFNDWLEDEEVDRLLQLYEKKNIDEL